LLACVIHPDIAGVNGAGSQLRLPTGEDNSIMRGRIENVTVHSIERLRLSVNGNPRFRLYTDHGNYDTETDASFNYGIENYTNSRRPESFIIGNPSATVTLLTTGTRQRVYGFERNGKTLH
jgi:hypothetical protein